MTNLIQESLNLILAFLLGALAMCLFAMWRIKKKLFELEREIEACEHKQTFHNYPEKERSLHVMSMECPCRPIAFDDGAKCEITHNHLNQPEIGRQDPDDAMA